jgi:group I intron endonuclease
MKPIDYLKQPAIYILTNIINGKVYVGETMNMRQRVYCYKNNTFNRPIKHAIRKYGIESFRIEVEYFPHFTKDDLLLIEETLIERFNCLAPNGYNVCKKGLDNTGRMLTEEHKRKIGDGNRGKIVSEETKAKMKAYQSNMPDDHKKAISEAKKNAKFKFSEETKEKMRQAKVGRKQSKEHIEKCRISRIGKSKLSTQQIQEVAEMLRIGGSPSKIATKYNIHVSTIYKMKKKNIF